MVEHHHGNHYVKFSLNFLNYVKERNRLLNTWRNITDPQLLNKNKIVLIGRVLSGPNYIKIIRAVKNKLAILLLNCFSKLTDSQILSKFKNESEKFILIYRFIFSFHRFRSFLVSKNILKIIFNSKISQLNQHSF